MRAIRLFDQKKILLLLVLFLLVFPKGGFKIGDIPITWGYLLLGITSLSLFILRPIQIQTHRLQSLLFVVPFQAISAFTIALNGVDNPAMLASFLGTFFLLPLIFYLFLSSSIDTIEPTFFQGLIKRSLFWISLYGLFLFFYRIFTGHFLEVPFLTINSADLGSLDSKYNLRVGISKLISTYNNGNIYGICLLMLLPLYSWLEKSFWKCSVVKLSLLFTLSRTVWIGLIVSELLFALFIRKSIPKKIGQLFLAPLLISVIVSLILLNLQLNWQFIWDHGLGGRFYQLSILSTFSLFLTVPFNGISEIVYLGILASFGIFGLITYLIAMIGPIFLSFANRQSSPLISCIRCGLCNYLILSCSDGAILLIPVMAIYWFLCSLLQSKNIASEPRFN